MHGRIRPRVTYANVTSTLALFLALTTGTAYAAATITGANIKDGTVTEADIKNKTLTSIDVKDGTLTSADVKNASLGGIDLIDGTVATVDVKDQSLTGTDIADGSIDRRGHRERDASPPSSSARTSLLAPSATAASRPRSRRRRCHGRKVGRRVLGGTIADGRSRPRNRRQRGDRRRRRADSSATRTSRTTPSRPSTLPTTRSTRTRSSTSASQPGHRRPLRAGERGRHDGELERWRHIAAASAIGQFEVDFGRNISACALDRNAGRGGRRRGGRAPSSALTDRSSNVEAAFVTVRGRRWRPRRTAPSSSSWSAEMRARQRSPSRRSASWPLACASP